MQEVPAFEHAGQSGGGGEGARGSKAAAFNRVMRDWVWGWGVEVQDLEDCEPGSDSLHLKRGERRSNMEFGIAKRGHAINVPIHELPSNLLKVSRLSATDKSADMTASSSAGATGPRP